MSGIVGIEKVEGIIVNELAYGETSKIINVITKEYGMIGIIAKGAKSLRSEFRSSTLKLTYGTFHIYYKEGKLSTLIHVDVLNPFRNIRKDIHRISYASFIIELSEQVIKQNPSKDIYPLLVSTIIKIEELYDPLVLTNILELKYLDYLGVMPVIDSCAMCGRTSSIATLSSTLGGYLCNHCRTKEPIVDERVIKLIRMYYYVDIERITKLDVQPKIEASINQFLDEYYDRYTGLFLKSKQFIQNLNKATSTENK